jgi:uncharacterized protein YdhG (YjbR/CyaY superfamily)
MADGSSDVETHLAKLPEPQRTTLLGLRATLRKVLPHADEMLKYGMPCFVLKGIGVAGYDAFKHHCSYFPMSGSVLAKLPDLPVGEASSKGTLQFPFDVSLPIGLVRNLVAVRLAEISDVSDGKRYDFYADGALKAEGSVRNGVLRGKWKWYRQDGSLMRVGQFTAGEQTGTWETWDREGRLVKTTKF